MDKVKKFKQHVKKHRKELYESGEFAKITVDSWIYTSRVPSYENACKISVLTGIMLTDIPYYKIERTT